MIVATTTTLTGMENELASLDGGLSSALAADSIVFKAPLNKLSGLVPSASIHPGPVTK
jgi:hypothetical protein